MGMSTHVVGFKPPDAKWKAMKKVWDACAMAGIEAPRQVEKFFEHETPDDAGVEVDLKRHDSKCCRDFNTEGAQGFEIDLTKIPKDITLLRFFNSW